MTPHYEHSGVRLYHGDAVSVLRDLGLHPQLVLTSPPYDELRDYGGTAFDFDAMADGIVSVMPEGGVLVWVVGDQTVDGSETGTSFRHVLGFMDRGLLLHDTMIYERGLPRFSSRTNRVTRTPSNSCSCCQPGSHGPSIPSWILRTRTQAGWRFGGRRSGVETASQLTAITTTVSRFA